MNIKILAISLIYGGIAGIISAITLQLMLGLQHHIWQLGNGPIFIFSIVLIGGILLAALQHKHSVKGLNEAIAEASNPSPLLAKKTALLAISAIIAVAFGASIGPEAGLVAVVAELSILVKNKIAQTQEEARALGAAGNAAVLASIYGSPPGAVSYEDDTITPSKVPAFLAALNGFLLFMITLKFLGADHHALELPLSPRGDVSIWWQAIPASILGCAVALLFTWFHHQTEFFANKISYPWLKTIIGTIVLAALLAAVPLLRFSGHAELPELVTFIQQSSWLALFGVAILKCVATAISLTSGWSGGEFFPLAFAGAAAGSLSLAFIPNMDVGTALVAGMVAATTVAIKKPIAILFIMVFMLPGTAIGPLIIASIIALIFIKIQQTNLTSSAHQ